MDPDKRKRFDDLTTKERSGNALNDNEKRELQVLREEEYIEGTGGLDSNNNPERAEEEGNTKAPRPQGTPSTTK